MTDKIPATTPGALVTDLMAATREARAVKADPRREAAAEIERAAAQAFRPLADLGALRPVSILMAGAILAPTLATAGAAVAALPSIDTAHGDDLADKIAAMVDMYDRLGVPFPGIDDEVDEATREALAPTFPALTVDPLENLVRISRFAYLTGHGDEAPPAPTWADVASSVVAAWRAESKPTALATAGPTRTAKRAAAKPKTASEPTPKAWTRDVTWTTMTADGERSGTRSAGTPFNSAKAAWVKAFNIARTDEAAALTTALLDWVATGMAAPMTFTCSAGTLTVSA